MINTKPFSQPWFPVTVIIAVIALMIACGSSDYHPDSMSLQREAMKVYSRKPDSALAILDKAIDMDPSYYVSYNTKAMILQKKNQHDKAIVELHKSLRWKEDQPEVYLQIGMMHEVKNRPEKAQDAFLNARAMFEVKLTEENTHKTDDEVNLAVTRIMLEEEGAITQLTELHEKNPDHPVLKMLHEAKAKSAGQGEIDKQFCIEVLFENR